jgi:RNA polymerase sigma-70 factor (ECF subfamily)
VEGYNGTGNFEGWMRKIMVNEALMQLRRRQPLVFPGDAMPIIEEEDGFNIVSELSVQEMMRVVEELPVGYRTVFNLFVLEGYKHHEIAHALQISINTSKSQLILAKDKLRKLLRSKGYL